MTTQAITFKIPKNLLENVELLRKLIILKATRYIPLEHQKDAIIRLFFQDGDNNDMVTIRIEFDDKH